jgi:hypothetical protein
MKLAFLIFLNLCLFRLIGLAQYDTIYHPFHGDQQLIEIKPTVLSFAHKGFIEIEANQVNADLLPRLILRDEEGTIIQKFNFIRNDQHEIKLRTSLKGSDYEKPHHLKTKNTSNYIGNDDSGYNIVYPIVECDDFEGGKCINPRIGLMDTLGKVVVPVEYDHIKWIDSIFIVQNNGKYSMYSHDFQLLLSNYQLIDYMNTFRDHILIKQNNKFGLVHRSGKNLLLKEFDLIRDSKYMPGHYEFLKNGLWGFVDQSFTSYLEPFSPSPNLLMRDGYFQFRDGSEMWNILDSTGQIILRSTMEMYQVLSRDRFLVYKYSRENGYERFLVDAKGIILTKETYYDLWRVNPTTLLAGYDAKIHDDSNMKKSYKWVLLDYNGQLRSKNVYKGFQLIDSDFLGVWSFDNKLQVIDGNLKDVLVYEIEDVYKYSDHLYKIKVKGKHQFLDLHDPRFISKKYDQILCLKENRIGVQSQGLWGFIDAFSYREILPTIADQIICFEDGLACYKKDNKWSIIDSLGQKITNDLFTNVQLLENGFIKVEINKKYGVIDRKGKYVIPLIFDEMKFVIQHEGKSFIGVRRGDKYGIINLKNELIYPFIFESCAELTYHATVAYGRKDGYYAFLTIRNRRTVEHHSLNFNPAKDHIKIQPNPSSGFRVIEEKCSQNPNGKCFGVINWDGIQIIPPVYSHIKDLRYNTFEIATKKGLGLADTNGRIIIPPVHKYMYELSGDSSLLQVGRHQGPWGLYTRNGQRLADTIYGGFEKPIYSFIPFYANFNHRIENNAWVRDPTKIGFMNRNGEIVIPALYDRYYVDSPKKGLIRLMYQDQTCVINGEGELIEGRFSEASQNYKPANNEFSENEKSKKKRKKLTKRKKNRIRWL